MIKLFFVTMQLMIVQPDGTFKSEYEQVYSRSAVGAIDACLALGARRVYDYNWEKSKGIRRAFFCTTPQLTRF